MKLSKPVERVVAAQLLSKNSVSTNNSASTNITTQIHQKTVAKYNRELREELFHNNRGNLYTFHAGPILNDLTTLCSSSMIHGIFMLYLLIFREPGKSYVNISHAPCCTLL